MERLTDRGFRFNAWREAPKERKDVPSVENVYLRLQELENMIEDGQLVKRRPKAEWRHHEKTIGSYYDYHYCSNCGRHAETLTDGGGMTFLSDFCPHCGSEMREERT